MKEVVIRGPAALFPQLIDVKGIALDHSQAGDDGSDHVLLTYVTDDAIAAIEAVGLDVQVLATEQQQSTLLAQVLQAGGPDVTGIA